MGTKLNPGKFDCYHNAMIDEPIFVLSARDPDFAFRVRSWAEQRQRMIECGERPISDMEMVGEAYQCALDGANWRRQNNGAWRKPATPPNPKLDNFNSPDELDIKPFEYRDPWIEAEKLREALENIRHIAENALNASKFPETPPSAISDPKVTVTLNELNEFKKAIVNAVRDAKSRKAL